MTNLHLSILKNKCNQWQTQITAVKKMPNALYNVMLHTLELFSGQSNFINCVNETILQLDWQESDD